MKSVTLLFATAASLAFTTPLAAQTVSAAAKPAYGDWGYNAASMDRSVKPGDDFWAYVNGSWDKETPIAADRASAGVGVVVSDQAEAQVRSIVEQLAADPGGSPVARQVGDFYGTWMDTAAIEQAGTAPLKPYLVQIDAARTRSDLLTLFMRPGFATPLDIGIIPDPADPKHYVAFATQATLGLPDRDYYLLTDAKMAANRAAYRSYIIAIETLAGIGDAAAKADRIMALETAISKEQWDQARRRDIAQIYNPMNREQMTALAPEFDWTPTLAGMGLGKIDTVVVAEKSAIQATGKLLASTPIETWKEWLTFRFISDHASALPKAFDDMRFGIYSKQLNGVEVQRDRWKRGIQMVNGSLGEAVGQIYVERHYPAASNAQMAELIDNLLASYKERISSNQWMDEATRKEALAKLASFDPRIGHPVKYIDYSSMKVVRGDMLGNAMRAGEFEWNLQLSRLPNPVDRGLWDMTPQEVNAYYDPLNNQITFPAAILQPPFFDPYADAAANYGAIGAVIGHEIGHGFDDQGRKFDATGRIRDWWTPAAAKAYTMRTEALGKQYDSYEPIAGTHINGKLTMGENLGDLGGVVTAYAAYRKHVAKHGEQALIDGLTGDQRFFIAYAQAWQSKRRDAAMQQQLLTDPHSPAKYRVNGIVRNVDAWYKAFNVQPGDKLYLTPEQRVRIW
jgi:putative endopeptidase